MKGLFQLLLSPYILTSSSILRRGFRSRQTDRLSSRHLAPQALMLMPMIMSGTVMATATLAAMISLRIMSSSVCDGAQTVMEGVRPFMWGQGSQNASACFPWPLADHLPRPLQSRLQALHQMPKSFPGAPVCNPSGAWASDARPRRDADALQRPVFIPPPPPARGRPPIGKLRRGPREWCAARNKPAESGPTGSRGNPLASFNLDSQERETASHFSSGSKT